MTRQQAELVPELNISVDDAAENFFYIALYINCMTSKESIGNIVKAVNSLSGQDKRIEKALDTALKMTDNVKKYGIPCAQWCN